MSATVNFSVDFCTGLITDNSGHIWGVYDSPAHELHLCDQAEPIHVCQHSQLTLVVRNILTGQPAATGFQLGEIPKLLN
jgi:hypothetical protein